MVFVLLMGALGGTARAQMVAGVCATGTLSCTQYDVSAGICDTEVYQCDPINLGEFGGTIYLCESTTYSKPVGGTACESDNNPCTTDACGACTTSGCTTGDGVCHHTAVADTTPCGGPNEACYSGNCGCNANTFACAANGGCVPNGTCCDNTQCAAGGHVCTGPGGSCVCPGGTYDCSGTCVGTATCCPALANCSSPANGTAACSGVGGSCGIASCNTGFNDCGTSCLQCCNSSQCPNSPSTNQQGNCVGGTCTLACIANYKLCNTTCIPSSQCCQNSDCNAPPNGCYVATGTCTSGTCKYTYNNNGPCNADNTKCTPNDYCMNGTCIADTAHQVQCVQRDCHTKPSCDATTGDCDDTAVSNGTACGANGCNAAAGTCTNGTCSTQPKDCSSLNTDCQVGACDASGPVGTPCMAVNKPNSTACSLMDRCQLNTSCSGGTCVGTAVTCTASGACRNDACDSTTGQCAETIAASGSSCNASCQQNATCDDNGDCHGDPVPDSTPCQLDGCSTASICKSGACTCLSSNADGGTTVVTTGATDGGVKKESSHKGCSMTPGEPGDEPSHLPVAVWVCVVVIALLHRRTRADRSTPRV